MSFEIEAAKTMLMPANYTQHAPQPRHADWRAHYQAFITHYFAAATAQKVISPSSLCYMYIGRHDTARYVRPIDSLSPGQLKEAV